MPDIPRCVVLASRPRGAPRESDFRVETREPRALREGELRTRNLYVSLDAGFRHWMDEGSGDDVLPAMALGAPVTGLVLGRVVESRRPDRRVGELLVARLAWEEASVAGAGDFVVGVPDDGRHPPRYYLGVLGDTGLSAYFGLLDHGALQRGETVLVSAAGGAVGSVAVQLARILGARAVGIASGAAKCTRVVRELGCDASVDRHAPDLDSELDRACPSGVDVYFDNVGGPLLERVLARINSGARVLLCGAVATYNAREPLPGPNNLFQLVTKQARMVGFMTHHRVARYPEGRAALARWIQSGELRVPEYLLHGIESLPRAFCDLFRGANFGKTLVEL
jgi:NADPH-dependent curcumin reductase CurA